MKKKKIAICGSPSFSIPFFQELKEDPEVEIVFGLTQNGKAKNRGKKIEKTKVAQWCIENEIECIEIESIKRMPLEEKEEVEKKLSELDSVLLFAFGQIIPQKWLNLPKNGWLNIHPSDLPKLRGPSPIQYTILEGSKQSAITLMEIDSKMDEGNIISKLNFEINEEETFEDLVEKICKIGPNWILKKIKEYLNKEIKSYKQEGEATYSKLIKKSDYILKEKGKEALRKIRALGYVKIERENDTIKCYKAKLKDKESKIEFNEIEPLILQLPGKNKVNQKEYLNGLKNQKKR